MSNLELYDAFRAVPKEAQKTIKGGRLNGFTDINPMWRIKMLTERFGPAGLGWYTETGDRWENTQGQQVAVFLEVRLYVKVDGEWSKPIVGVGGSKVVAQESSGLFLNDEAWKMAYTDALGICCKALGMAADIYFDKDARSKDNMTKYDAPEGEAQAAGSGTAKPSFNPTKKAWQQAIDRARSTGDITRAKLEEFYLVTDANWKKFCEAIDA